ncbi:hypothetical protein SCHPADRAFT_941667 [Schizopora paradoxa]|uniref:Uncharacterized protein n=1 Tax=Schizopora paradoxa TaxID=27342 RepID=A0A0H2RK31_9AGAM|nr:hypothetical protein SCHPADRAFT_941667 [Schizopora paradoxa]
MAFSAAESKLVSIFCQSVLYGVYVVLFTATTYTLLWGNKARRSVRRHNMLFVSFLIFVIATMHMATNFSRIVLAFIIHADAPGGPAAFFNELSNFTQMFGSTLYVFQTLLGDALVLYRSYLVWERKLWIVAFPCLLLLGSTATGIGILYAFDKVVPLADVFVVQLGHWITAFFSMTFTTNVICTSLVAYRIWTLNHRRKHGDSMRRHALRPALLLIVESGACYSATLLALLILYNVDSWFQYVVLDSVSPIVGIVFSVIMLRIASGVSTEEGETALLGESGVVNSGGGGVQLSVLDADPDQKTVAV